MQQKQPNESRQKCLQLTAKRSANRLCEIRIYANVHPNPPRSVEANKIGKLRLRAWRNKQKRRIEERRNLGEQQRSHEIGANKQTRSRRTTHRMSKTVHQKQSQRHLGQLSKLWGKDGQWTNHQSTKNFKIERVDRGVLNAFAHGGHCTRMELRLNYMTEHFWHQSIHQCHNCYVTAPHLIMAISSTWLQLLNRHACIYGAHASGTSG